MVRSLVHSECHWYAVKSQLREQDYRCRAALCSSLNMVERKSCGRHVGQFNVTLREGVYTAFGGGPDVPQLPWQAGKSFRIVAGHTLKVVVWCVAL